MREISVLGLIMLMFCVSISVGAHAQEYVVGQKDKKFSAEVITIKVGDTLKFTNQDPFFHNIYSFSPTKSFDLGSFPKGDSASVKFDNQGVVEVKCAIHPKMYMRVNIVK